MKPTLKFVSLILALVFCVGVTVSCFRSIASDGALDFTIGGSRTGSGSVSGGSSGSSFSGGSGSGSASTSSGEGSGGSYQPLPANYYDVGNQRYHLEGYTAYPSSSVKPNWFCRNSEISSLSNAPKTTLLSVSIRAICPAVSASARKRRIGISPVPAFRRSVSPLRLIRPIVLICTDLSLAFFQVRIRRTTGFTLFLRSRTISSFSLIRL